MEIVLGEHFPLPNLDNFDLSELSCDETCSPPSSAEHSPLSSPTSLDMQLHSPSSSISSQSTSSGSMDSMKHDPDPSRSSQTSGKHRAKCQAPLCIRKEHVSILRRNERERNRVKLVSDGFATLRKHVPTAPMNKKLSKVETLRTAIEYIRHLQKMLNESNKMERERRLCRQVGWFQEAYNMQAQSGMSVLQQNQINALLMDLPEIAPYPSHGRQVALDQYYSSMG